MKRILLILTVAVMTTSCGVLANVDASRALYGATKALQAATITDEQVQSYMRQYVAQLDASNKICAANSTYSRRLATLTKGLTDVDGLPLNFKVYQTNQVNAFACADGSVRVYSALMDIMTDDELVGVLGHEMGHVALHHTRKQMQKQMLTSAAMQGIASAGDNIAALTDSQLGALGEAILNAKYSRTMENEADDYGYNFLCECGKNPWSMVMSFEKLEELAGGSQSTNTLTNLFSSHPETAKRIEHISQRCINDVYSRPAASTAKTTK